MRVLLEPSFVLHRRAYGETSFLVDIYTQNHGRLTLVAKGVRKARSLNQALLQPFTPLLISFTGNGELKILISVESRGEIKQLKAACLFAGFYSNELLMSLTQKWDANPALFLLYETLLVALETLPLNQSALRLFEKKFLEELGYGMLSKSMIDRHNTFLPDKHYRFMPESGFELSDDPLSFSGQSLLDYIQEEWRSDVSLLDAKRLNRMRLSVLLGKKKLHSRELFTIP